MTIFDQRIRNLTLLLTIFFVSIGLVGCAHPISIMPTQAIHSDDTITKNLSVAYVLSDEMKNQEVITNGGGGDKISYKPYNDLEKTIRDSLRAVYKDVVLIKSTAEAAKIQENSVSLIFHPEIKTSSGSSSILTWPPTEFKIDFSCPVTNAAGDLIDDLKVVGTGNAEFSEFKSNFGLAGARAADDLGKKLYAELLSNQKLK